MPPIPEQITDHRAEAVALLTDKWRDKTNVKGVLRALVKPYDALETATFEIIENRVLDNAAGVWLEAWGRVVGEGRGGRSDADYRFGIKIRLRILRSKGRAEDIIEIANLLDETATYIEYAPLAWEVEIYETSYGGTIIRALTQAKAAASYGVLLTSEWEGSILEWGYI